MSEGRNWQCGWEPADHGRYRVWVVGRKDLVEIGATWQLALDTLCDAICLATGDGEPNLQFDPPPPVFGADPAWIDASRLLVHANGYLPMEYPADKGLWSGGFCERCEGPMGRRSTASIRARGPAEGDLCMAMDGTNVNCPTVFSERCMELLTRDERSCFDWIPVRMPARTRKKYFECVPRDFVQRVAVTDWPVHGNRCPRCKRVFMAVSPDARLDYQNNKIHSWAAASDVDAIPANCPFAFGDASMWSLVLPMDRARELTKHKHALGLTTARFGVVPPSQVLLREDEATPERLVLPDRWELRRK